MEILFKQICHKGTKARSFRFSSLFSIFFFLFSISFFAQQFQKDSTKVTQLDDVLVSAIRVTTKTPVSFSNLSNTDFQTRNVGQDIPILMNFLPSVVTTSDAGNGVGYTGIRVRGSDATRVNVTINGIPYNDAEESGTYFVDLPDFASSVGSLQLQRGVGTSTNGAGAFGASLNMLTDSYSKKSYGEIASSAGSFSTLKNTVKFSTGLMNDHFELAGRFSQIKSDGYIERATSDLKSYFLQGTYVGKTTLIKALLFGGKEKTYQSWNGVDAETMAGDRTFNFAGMYTDAQGNIKFYDNQTDNYQQDHFQLHWNEKLSSKWSSNLAIHYTKGRGYYENYNNNVPVKGYGNTLPTEMVDDGYGNLVPGTNLIDQKWLDNNFYGTTFSLNYTDKKVDFIFGGAYNQYRGKHFGEVLWSQDASNLVLGEHYNDYYGNKNDGNVFAKVNYQLTKKFSLFGDLQVRNVTYKADGVGDAPVDDHFNFFNPKAGLNYVLTSHNLLYFSYARANREPNRTDYEGGGIVKPEKLNDFEMGWRHTTDKIKWTTNLYYMAYKDQLILTGNLDDVGNPIRANSEKSYRLGVELEATMAFTKHFFFSPNITISQNKNLNLNVDGTNYGNKDIAYSPNVVAGTILMYKPNDAVQFSLLSKFVGAQYLNNIELDAARLPDYFVNDLNISYEWKPKSIFKSILFTGLCNNMLGKQYISNGYMYDVTPYYYPQAGRNFLGGMTLKF